MPRFTAYSITRIRAAAEMEPIDWAAIRGAAIALGRRVGTPAQRTALQMLKGATDRDSLGRAADTIEQAFDNDL